MSRKREGYVWMGSGGKPANAIPGYQSWQFHRMFGHETPVDGCSWCGDETVKKPYAHYRVYQRSYKPSKLWGQ